MRLTLRTLLAYLDDLLDDQQAAEIEQKIESSPRASELVHRVRNTIGQIRLDAPSLNGKELADDPNMVAEYLDNTLSPDQVPDFERVCLDSDIHLGEVAACHQVLTLVLAEPAHVDAGLRNRIHSLASSPTRTTSAPIPVDSLPDNASHRIDTPQPTAEEPWKEDVKTSYVRPQRSYKSVMMMAVAAVILLMAGIIGLGPLDRSHPIAQLFGVTAAPENDEQESVDSDLELDANEIYVPDAPPEDEHNVAPDPSDETVFEDPPPQVEEDETFAFDSANDDQIVEAEAPSSSDFESDSTEFFEQPAVEPIVDDNNSLAIEDPTDLVNPTDSFDSPETSEIVTDDTTNDSLDEGRDDESELGFNAPNVEPLIVPPEPQVVDAAAQPVAEANRENVDNVPSFPDTNETVVEADASVTDDAIGDLNADPPISNDVENQPQVVELGRLLTPRELVVYLNKETQMWERATEETSVVFGDDLTSLPIYRPQFEFTNGLLLTMVGASQLGVDEESIPEHVILNIKHGRFLLQSNNGMSNLALRFGNRRGQLSFDDPQSTVALELKHVHFPGSDPTTNDAHALLSVHVISGNVSWIEAESDAAEIALGRRLVILDDRAATVQDFSNEPAWVSGADEKPRDPIAKKQLEPKIDLERPVTLALFENADSRIKLNELRSLSACSLAHFGEFGPIIATLNDPGMKAYWPEIVKALRTAIANDQTSATKVREAFEMLHSERGHELFRMLWGYSPSELQAGADDKLVAFLEDESLDFRVLAIEALKQITGRETMYSAANPSVRSRTRHSAQWKKHAENGRIAYANTPEIIQLLNEE